MEIDYITTLGITAGILTTIAYLPQLIKTWQSKSAGDISWTMLIVLCLGIILWFRAFAHEQKQSDEPADEHRQNNKEID